MAIPRYHTLEIARVFSSLDRYRYKGGGHDCREVKVSEQRTMRKDVVVSSTDEYGIVVEILDPEVADRFEGYLTDNHYVLFDVKFENESVHFFFGQASSLKKVEALCYSFLKNH